MKSTENSVTKNKHNTSAEVCYLAEFFLLILSLSLPLQRKYIPISF